MTKILYTFLMLLLCTASFAQGTDPEDLAGIDKPLPSPKVARDTVDRIFAKIDQMPEFPGGMDEFHRYIKGNFKYPKQAFEEGIEGKVVTQFTVDKDGSIIDVIIKRHIGGGCDEEALRLIKGMPLWKPGMQSGKPVRVFHTMPLDFKLGR